jgi:hypothetical protein
MNELRLDILDSLEGSLRRSMALSDLLCCVKSSELGDETVNEIGYQLYELLEQSRKSLKNLQYWIE